MRFFSKLVVICNICFIISVIIHYLQIGSVKAGKPDVAEMLPTGVAEIVILGYVVAVILNTIFFLTCIITFFSNKGKSVPRWMYIFNGLLLIFQILYFSNVIP